MVRLSMSKRDQQDGESVWDEPHMRIALANRDGAALPVEPSEAQPESAPHADDAQLHSVHNELSIFPTGGVGADIDREWPCDRCGYDLQGATVGEPCPECGFVQFSRPVATDRPGYAQWLKRSSHETAWAKRWAVLVGIVLCGGLLSILGTFVGQFAYGPATGAIAVVAMVMIGPTVEELMKIGLALIVVETRPAWFASTRSIWIATIASAFGFAAIENLIYLNIYVPNPPSWLIGWRWSVCVALHVSATAIATIGLTKMWSGCVTRLTPPRAKELYPFVLTAIIVHGAYNALALGLELGGVF